MLELSQDTSTLEQHVIQIQLLPFHPHAQEAIYSIHCCTGACGRICVCLIQAKVHTTTSCFLVHRTLETCLESGRHLKEMVDKWTHGLWRCWRSTSEQKREISIIYSGELPLPSWKNGWAWRILRGHHIFWFIFHLSSRHFKLTTVMPGVLSHSNWFQWL